MNPETIRSRRNNARKMIRLILASGEVTRPLLASSFNLSLGTVTNIVTDLLDRGLIVEGRKGNSAAGRKATYLRFNGGCASVVCVNLNSPDTLEVSLCSLSGALLSRRFFPLNLLIDANNNDIAVLEGISRSVAEFLDALEIHEKQRIRAAVISVGGIVIGDSAVYAPFYHWDNLPLGNHLRRLFTCPVLVENVTRIQSVFELRYLDENDKNVLYLSLSPGLGLVQFFGGRMVVGKNGISGEAGHMTLDINGPPCYCGNRGCAEIYCSEISLLHRLRAALQSESACPVIRSLAQTPEYQGQSAQTSIALLFRARQAGSLWAHQLLSETARYLGGVIVSLYNLYDPDQLIISGSLVEGDRYVLDQAIVEAKSRMIRRYLQEVRISVARLKSGEQEKAACAYALDKIIDTMLG